MAILLRGVGAYGAGTTSCTAAAPTNGGTPQDNDIALIVCESTDSSTAAGTPNTPSGWTKLFERTQGDGVTGVTTLTVFGKRVSGSQGNVTVDGVLNHVSARMIVYSGCITSGDAWTVGSGNGNSTSATITFTGLTTPAANCMVLLVCCITRDAASTANLSSWANSNLTSIQERIDNSTNTAVGGGIGLAEGLKSTAGVTGDSTAICVVGAQWSSVHISLTPQAAFDDSVSVSRKESVSNRSTMDAIVTFSISEKGSLTDILQVSIGKQVSINQLTGFNNSASTGAFSVINLADRLAILHGVNLTAQSRLSLGEREGVSASVNLTSRVAVLIAERLGIANSLTVAIFPIVGISEREGFSVVGNLVVASNTSLNKRLFVVTESSVDTSQIVAIVQTLSNSLGLFASAQANMLASLPISERAGISEGVSQLLNSGLGLGAIFSIVTLSDTNVIIVSGFGYVFTQDLAKFLSAPSDTSSSVETGDS